MKGKEFLVKYSRIMILVLLMAGTSIASPDFLKADNLLNVARQSSMLLIMSLGMTCAMLLGRGVDMSIGATLSLTSCVAAGFLRSNDTVGSVLIGIILALLIGIFIGLVNGMLVAYLHLPAILVTYGVREIIRSIAFFYMDGDVVSGFHKMVMFMGSGFAFGKIPTQIIIALILTVATAWMLKHTRMGRELYVVGANPSAAKFSGLKVEKSVVLGFVLSGTLAALAGIVYLGRLGAAEAEIGTQFHFQCVSAVAIGGISFAGGAGSAWGAVIGALILNILINGMNLLNISSYWQGTVNGVIIIIAVLLDYVVSKKQTK
ncbi:MAG: ABC transporter permease [Lachnospiraceae bacterium]|jgi:ribose transport system permease protein